uniref:SRCR domain-containing protein n=1 Tax=Oryzias latipes TaxID=8090 RepID=A0A3P9JFH2_ORYLA
LNRISLFHFWLHRVGVLTAHCLRRTQAPPCLKWTEFPHYVMQYPGRSLGTTATAENRTGSAIGWTYCDCPKNNGKSGLVHLQIVSTFEDREWDGQRVGERLLRTGMDGESLCMNEWMVSFSLDLGPFFISLNTGRSGGGLSGFVSCSGTAKAWSWAHVGQGSVPILLDAVKSTGNDILLDQRSHGDWEQHNGDHMEDAAVSCKLNFKKKILANKKTSLIRLLYFLMTKFFLGHAEVVTDEFFGKGAGLIFLDDVHCEGSETPPSGYVGSLLEKKLNETNKLYVQNEWPLVQLVGGSSRKEGRVEVYFHGDWEALGLERHERATAAGGFGQGKGPLHLDQVRCTGKEEFLGEGPSLGQNIQGCGKESTICNQIRKNWTTWSWQVSAGLQSQREGEGPLCSGMLISPCWAPTSAFFLGGDPTIHVQLVLDRKFKGQSGGHDLILLKLPSTKGHCLTFDPNTYVTCFWVVMVTTGWAGPERTNRFTGLSICFTNKSTLETFFNK